MSCYDNWKPAPAYGLSQHEYRRRMAIVDAVRSGWGGYDNPLEALHCAMARRKYRGEFNGEPFYGVPTLEDVRHVNV